MVLFEIKQMEQNGPEKIFNILESLIFMEGFPDSSVGKESVFNAGPQFNSWVGKFCWRRDRLPTQVFWGFPCGSAGKKSSAGDLGLIPGLGSSPGEGKGHFSILAWRIP